ncbi:MAG: AI-2E family transporter [Lishizhenia sp.]
MRDLRTTNILLLLVAVPIVFFILKTLKFIFIPLLASMFIALLFLPLMRKMTRWGIPKFMNVIVTSFILIGIFYLAGKVIEISGNEIIASQDEVMAKAEVKLQTLFTSVEERFSLEEGEAKSSIISMITGNSNGQVGNTLNLIKGLVSTLLMTLFFILLLVADSINIEKALNSIIFKRPHLSVKIFRTIEKDIIKFAKVKFIISLLTGVGFTISCLAFDVSFPIFWGLFAFLINFVQTIGSVISVVLCAIFAFVEINSPGALIFFTICITMTQVIMGGILEPVFMGKTFSINVITILVMLMLWGYIWGVPGLIMSIPITVILRIIFDQFPRTQIISKLMAGSEGSVSLISPKKK